MKSIWRLLRRPLLRRPLRAQRLATLAEARLTVERARAALAALPTDRQRSITAALLRAVCGSQRQFSR